MPPRHSNSRHKQPPKNTADKFRAELRRNVLAAVSPNVPYNTRRAAKAAASTPSTRDLAAQLPASRETIRKIINSTSSSYSPPNPRGRPALLTASEDAALAAFIVWLEKSGFPAEKSHIEDTALGFLHFRGIEKSEMSRNWYPRFRERHPELRKTFLKAVDKARKAFEVSDVEDIENFFSGLQDLILKYNIGPSEIWNEDECGIRIGTLRERIQVLVVRTTRSERPEVPDPSNRESCTQIGAANALGSSIPPWLIFKSLPTVAWAEIEPVPGMRFAESETGFSNQEITFEWLHSFNAFSWLSSAKARAKGISLTDWFGCDEWLYDAISPHSKLTAPPTIHKEEDKIYRLLVIDGFSGHLSFEFIQYCIQFDIVICILPSHSTHLTQPLDVGVFQALKNAHQKELRKSIREGHLSFNRLQFAAAFKSVYTAGFTKHNIMSGFEKAGIWPVSAAPVINRIIAKQRQQRKSIHPSILKMLPVETRFQDAQDQIERIYERYQEVMSSPTLEAIINVRNVVAEAALMHRERETFSADRLRRLEKYSKRRKTGQRVRPSGDFITSVGFPDIQAQHEASLAAAEVKEQRSQLRSTRTIIIREINALRARWREQNECLRTQGQPRLTFNQWLDQTDQTSQFVALETQRKEHNKILNKAPKKAFSEAQEQARRAARPIIAMDQNAWPDSDDEVEFRGIGPFDDDDDDVELVGFNDAGGDDIPGPETQLEMTSSPPLDPLDPADDLDDDNLTLPQLPVTTPRISGYKRVKNVMREFREEQATITTRATSSQQGHTRRLRSTL